MARYIAHVPDPDQLQELAAERDDVLKVLPRVHMLVLDCDQATADELADDPRVEWVEPDAQGEPASSPQTIVNEWQLDRIDQRELPLDDEYHWTRDGTGVHVYIVDSGIRDTHEAFAGRIGAGFTAVGGTAYTDNEGHGTLVAGVAVGATTGAARGATIHSVRVWDDVLTSANFVDGIDWILNNHDFEEPGIVNVSLLFNPSATVDDAVEDLLDAGLQVCCAAGNEDDLASTKSPARVERVITVSSTENDDAFRDGHNFGPAVDILAPGRDTWTTQNSGDTAYGAIGGTSVASAIVCGVAALILEQAPDISARNLKESLLRGATEGEITGLPAETPNLLVYSFSEPFLGASQPQINIGTFEKRIGTGLQTVTWETDDYWPEDEFPEAIIFFGIGVNADPINDGQAFTPLRWGLGFATPNGSASHGVSKLNTSGLSNVKRRASGAAFQTLQPGSTAGDRNIAVFDLELVNGFRLNWTVNDHDFDHLIGFVAIGGGGIQANVAAWQYPGSTGLFPIEDIGFEPDVVFHTFSRFDDNLGAVQQNGGAAINMGAMDRAGNQWSMSTQLPTGSSPGTVRTTNDDLCISYAAGTLNAQPVNAAKFESMDEDGFTLDIVNTTADRWGLSLAIKGGVWDVGMFEQSDSLGTQQIALPDMHPLGLLFCTAMLTEAQVNDGSKATAFLSIGAGNEDLNRAISNASANGSNFDRQLQNSTAIIVNTETDFDPIAAQASVTSLEDEQATITWDSADNTGAMIGYVAFGQELSGAPPVPTNVQAVAQDHQSILVTWDPVEP